MRKFRFLMLLFGLLAIFGVSRVIKGAPVEYTMTFNVTVPDGTEGNVFVVGEFTNWLEEPTGPLEPIQLTKSAGNVYSGSAMFTTEKTSVQYKYINAKDLASISWKYGEVYGGNRLLDLNNPTANDTVSSWGAGGFKYPLTIKYFVDGVQQGATSTPSVSAGDILNLTKKAGSDTFAFWKIDGAVRTDLPEEFSMRVKMEMHFEAHYVSNTKWAVVFLDSNLKELKTEYIAKEGGTNPSAPTAPSKTMLTFNGFALISTPETPVVAPLPAPTANTFYVANYSLNASYGKRNVTINGGSPTLTDVGSVVTAEALDPHFSYWIDDNTGAILSHQNPYKFTLLDQDISLRSIHGQGDKSTEPMVSIRRYFNLKDGYDTFVGQFDNLAPELYDVIQFGFVHSTTPESEDMQMFSVSSYNPETNEFMVSVPDDTGQFQNNDYKMRTYLMYYQKDENIPENERFKVIMNLSHYEIVHEVLPHSTNPAGTQQFYMVTSLHGWDAEKAIPVVKHPTYYDKYYSREIIVTYPGYELEYQYKYLYKKNWKTVENLVENRYFTKITLANTKDVQKFGVETHTPWKALDTYRVYLYDESLANHFHNLTKEVELYYQNLDSNTHIQEVSWDDRPTFLRDEENGYWYFDIPLNAPKSTLPNFGLKLNEKGNADNMWHQFANFDVTKPYMSFEKWISGGMTPGFDVVQLDFVQSLIYEAGFEASEGFTVGSTYYPNISKHDGNNGTWGVYYGNISTNNVIAGEQSLELRYDSSRPSVRGYAFTDFELEKVDYIDVETVVYSSIDAQVAISISNDGGKTWVAKETFAVGLTGACTYNVPEAYKNDKLRIKIAIEPDALGTGTAKLIIDNIKVYGVIPNTFSNQVDVQLATLVVPAIITDGSSIPTVTQDGTPIHRWGSSQPSVISPHHPYTVNRPAAGNPDAIVIMTADVKKGEVIKSRAFEVTVPALE